MDNETPNLKDVWDNVNQSRIDIAELRGMIKMHFEDGRHHYPPCDAANHMQKTMLSAVGAALLALIAAIGGIVSAFITR